MRDKTVTIIVALCAVTLIGVTIAFVGIDGVVIGTCIGMMLLLVRETYAERKTEVKEEEEHEGEA
jgi:MFS superfamily sulfate permease-like transporter